MRIRHLNKKTELEERYSDYRDFAGGLRLPVNAVSIFGERMQTYVLENATVNPTELKDEDFRPPTVPLRWLDELKKRFK